jgi:hypothetical protein
VIESDDVRVYARVIAIWVAVLAALFVFQQIFS